MGGVKNKKNHSSYSDLVTTIEGSLFRWGFLGSMRNENRGTLVLVYGGNNYVAFVVVVTLPKMAE